MSAAPKRCAVDQGIESLTPFAFSTENWRRPPDEVRWLQRLFATLLRRELHTLHENGVRLVVVSDVGRFDPDRVRAIGAAEMLTRDNRRLTLTVAASYGGRWDILQAVHRLLERCRHAPLPRTLDRCQGADRRLLLTKCSNMDLGQRCATTRGYEYGRGSCENAFAPSAVAQQA